MGGNATGALGQRPCVHAVAMWAVYC